VKPKAYLESIGAIKPGEGGRGRMSREHRALCEQGVKNGVQIDGFAMSVPAPNSTVQPAVQRVEVSNVKTIAELPPYRYHFETHRAYIFFNGKRRESSLAEICRSTGNGVSLVVCHCNAHTVVSPDARGTVRVYIEEK
jgi:hypothetical protein